MNKNVAFRKLRSSYPESSVQNNKNGFRRSVFCCLAAKYLAGMLMVCCPLTLHASVEVNEIQIRISKGACQFVSRHVPDADVAFKAGQGVNGKKVLPADINASPINDDMERLMRVRITNDAAKIFGLKVPEIKKGDETLPLAKPEVEGYIFLKDGVPYLGDKPLENEQQRQLAVLCRQSQTEE